MLHVTLAHATTLFLAAATLGAIDVFWFHLWKLRLYRQPSSVVEECTHLVSYGTFIAIGAALLAPGDVAGRRNLLVALFAMNLAVTALDVLAERASRAPLGGLPPLEYLLHVLVTFGIGAAAATYWWATANGTAAPLEGIDRTRVIAAVTFTIVLLVIEGALFSRAVAVRTQPRGQRPDLPALGGSAAGVARAPASPDGYPLGL
jgi:hypothetical protein